MKKYINIAFVYAILAMAGGVFYREFTKLNGFTGRTALSFVHTHLFLLGMVVFLLAALFAGRLALESCRLWRPFLVVYSFVAILGATVDLGLLWSIADTFNGLMAIPNLIALLLLSGTVVRVVREFFAGEGKESARAESSN